MTASEGTTVPDGTTRPFTVDDPVEAFALLSDETRVDTLRELARAGDPLGFATLRKRVGVRDGGRFSYHLEKLRGRFVEKTPEGYRLTTEGARVAELL